MADAQGSTPLRALVRMELRRTLVVARNSLSMGAVILGVLLITGAFTLPRLAFLLGVLSGAVLVTLAMSALRDKMDGGLEFLRFLPVPAHTHVLARLLTVLVVALPAAAVGTVAAVLALVGDHPEVMSGTPLVVIYSVLAFTYAAIGFVPMALVLRFDTSKAGYGPMIMLGVLLVLDRVEERYPLPDPLAAFIRLMTHGWFIPLVWISGLAVAAALGWFAFRLACQGIVRFSPPRDRITW